jgi:hypothetical protein
MDRREALALTSSLLGVTLVGTSVFLGGCEVPKKKRPRLTAQDIPLLSAMCDVILPESAHSPGAGEAQVGTFIQAIVSDCYTEEEESVFVSGLRKMEEQLKALYGKSFRELDQGEQLNVLTEYDARAREFEKEEKPYFYSMVLQLAIWGYFISEPGATKALRYNPNPGRFEGCVPYREGDKAWA